MNKINKLRLMFLAYFYKTKLQHKNCSGNNHNTSTTTSNLKINISALKSFVMNSY